MLILLLGTHKKYSRKLPNEQHYQMVKWHMKKFIHWNFIHFSSFTDAEARERKTNMDPNDVKKCAKDIFSRINRMNMRTKQAHNLPVLPDILHREKKSCSLGRPEILKPDRIRFQKREREDNENEEEQCSTWKFCGWMKRFEILKFSTRFSLRRSCLLLCVVSHVVQRDKPKTKSWEREFFANFLTRKFIVLLTSLIPCRSFKWNSFMWNFRLFFHNLIRSLGRLLCVLCHCCASAFASMRERGDVIIVVFQRLFAVLSPTSFCCLFAIFSPYPLSPPLLSFWGCHQHKFVPIFLRRTSHCRHE